MNLVWNSLKICLALLVFITAFVWSLARTSIEEWQAPSPFASKVLFVLINSIITVDVSM
jgi:hypothetical protein